MKYFAVALTILLSTGCAVGPPPASMPAKLTILFNEASAYQAAAGNRLCADPSLRPRFEDVKRRLALATETLVSRYGPAQAQAGRTAVISPSRVCSNPSAAATAVANFEAAVSNLESGLRQ
ncbi:MAG: hypothetical protein QOJ94_2037 [Sphingomonadales bacterium]|jgi:hypothetical protein|nr:hypothetical protein [Sphingomonadales bacterium]